MPKYKISSAQTDLSIGILSVGNKGRGVCAFFLLKLCCAAVLVCFLSGQGYCESLTFDASCTLEYGDFASQESALRVARAIALGEALNKASAALNSSQVLQGLDSPLRREALMYAVHRPALTVSPHTLPSPPEGRVQVSVRLTTPSRTLDARLRNALQHKDMLDFREELLADMHQISRQAKGLIYSATKKRQNGTKGFDPSTERTIEGLANKLEAYWLFDGALLELQTLWQNPNRCKEILQKATQLAPDSAFLWCALGELFLQTDQPQRALESLDTAAKLLPSLNRIYYIRGLVYLRMQQSALAEVDFTTVLRSKPDNIAALRARGAARMVREDYASMCEDFIKACSLGDCEGLWAARKQSLCRPSNPSGEDPAPFSPPDSPPAPSSEVFSSQPAQ